MSMDDKDIHDMISHIADTWVDQLKPHIVQCVTTKLHNYVEQVTQQLIDNEKEEEDEDESSSSSHESLPQRKRKRTQRYTTPHFELLEKTIVARKRILSMDELRKWCKRHHVDQKYIQSLYKKQYNYVNRNHKIKKLTD